MSGKARLLFSEGHFVAIVSGQKNMTLRLFREESHRFAKNQIVYGEFPEGISLMLEITEDTKLFTISTLPHEIAQADGYQDRVHAMGGLRRYYGSKLTAKAPLACIRFKIAEIYGEPVIKLTAN
jgi:hypothetical protein